MLEGILVGIFGNSIFTLIKGIVNSIIGDKDEDLHQRIYESLELATKDFFKKFGEIYTNPNSSFLARRSNISLIVQSIYFSSNINLLNELDRRGFDNEPDVTEEHLHYFINTLEKYMKKDFKLGKILEEKKHLQDSDIAHENIKEILDKVSNLSKDSFETTKKNWELFDLETGKEIPFREGKKYHLKYNNGVEQIFMMKDDIISVDFKDENGRWAYYEIDINKGSANNNKFPYPISDYKIVVNESDIINRTLIPLPNGYYQEVMTLKWGRTSKVIYDNQNRIQQFEVNGGWFVNHTNKTITPSIE